MPAGSFLLDSYEGDDGSFHQIKIQPETKAAVIGGDDNDAPVGLVDSPFAAEVNRGARAYGLRPRKINVAFESTPPTGYRPYTTVSIPVLKKATWIQAAAGDAVTYGGGTGKVTSKTAEDIRPGATALGSGVAAPA